MPSKDYLMLRSAQRAHLEARTATLQFICRYISRFSDSRFRGNDESERQYIFGEHSLTL
jgi:hypothetical protein